jgi:hypothetical protein
MRELAIVNGTWRPRITCHLCGEGTDDSPVAPMRSALFVWMVLTVRVLCCVLCAVLCAEGHKLSDCPSRQSRWESAGVVCLICGEKSHVKEDCPRKGAAKAAYGHAPRPHTNVRVPADALTPRVLARTCCAGTCACACACSGAKDLSSEYDAFIAEMEGGEAPVRSGDAYRAPADRLKLMPPAAHHSAAASAAADARVGRGPAGGADDGEPYVLPPRPPMPPLPPPPMYPAHPALPPPGPLYGYDHPDYGPPPHPMHPPPPPPPPHYPDYAPPFGLPPPPDLYAPPMAPPLFAAAAMPLPAEPQYRFPLLPPVFDRR